MRFAKTCIVVVVTFMTFILHSICDVTQMDSRNLDTILKNNEVVFVNFYADWCRFSRMLAPVFEEASNIISKQYTQPGTAILAKVDCDKEPDIAKRYAVNKYPTMKLFRGGQLVKREYRGQRSAESLADFVKEQLKEPVQEFKDLDVIYELPRDKRTIIGYFTSKTSPEFETFNAVAKQLKDDCQFYVGFGEVSQPERTTGDNIIFKPIGEMNPEMVYLGSLTNKDLLMAWSQDKCIPLVREITFANGEELTEEGLPFLILFHSKEDTESLEMYKREVSRLVSYKSTINFLIADCETFSHPLHHLGKSTRDCPLVAIDSFKHMYMFPNFDQINEPGKLKQFILDLNSGKLHREFHHGPDPVVPGAPEAASTPAPSKETDASSTATKKENLATNDINPKLVKNTEVAKSDEKAQPDNASQAASKDESNDESKIKKSSDGLKKQETPQQNNPPSPVIKSIFIKMKPSQYRYTILDTGAVRDEL